MNGAGLMTGASNPSLFMIIKKKAIVKKKFKKIVIYFILKKLV